MASSVTMGARRPPHDSIAADTSVRALRSNERIKTRAWCALDRVYGARVVLVHVILSFAGPRRIGVNLVGVVNELVERHLGDSATVPFVLTRTMFGAERVLLPATSNWHIQQVFISMYGNRYASTSWRLELR